jgi:hypothetical protein
LSTNEPSLVVTPYLCPSRVPLNSWAPFVVRACHPRVLAVVK